MGIICVEQEHSKSAAKHDRIAHLYVFERDKSGKKIMKTVDDFVPYMYAKEEVTIPSNFPGIASIEMGYKTIFGNKAKKLNFGKGIDPSRLKRMMYLYESDYNYKSRYITDIAPKIEQNPRICTLDIEVESSKEMPSPDFAKYRIICISIYDNYLNKLIWFVWRPDFTQKIERGRFKREEVLENGETYKIDVEYDKYFFSSEKAMMIWFNKYIQETDPDILTGWNINRFDMPYIVKREQILGINYKVLSPLRRVHKDFTGLPIVEGRVIFDSLTAYRRLQLAELDSYKLDTVAKHVLGFGKVEHIVKIGELWKTNFDKLEEYSVIDSLLVHLINEKEYTINYSLTIADIAKCQIYDTLYNKNIVDAYTMGYCHNKYVLPPRMQVKKGKYEGAVVIAPRPGVLDWVVGLDEEALYPSIIISYNMSPDTLISEDHPDFDKVPKSNAGDGVYFRLDRIGVLPKMLLDLFGLRKGYQKEMNKYEAKSEKYNVFHRLQFSVKALMNSFYGVLAYPKFRLYTPEIAAAITRVGRELLQWIKKKCEEAGYDVGYGDTDSVFVVMPKECNTLKQTIKIGYELEKIIDPTYDEFARNAGLDKRVFMMEDGRFHRFSLKFEKVYERIIFVGDPKNPTKKRYSGILVWLKGKFLRKLDIVGFDAIKSDSSALSREVQKEVLVLVLSKSGPGKVRDYVKKQINKIMNNEVDIFDLAIPKQIKKPFHLYKGGAANDAHIRGAKYSNYWLGTNFGPGTKPRRLYVQKVPSGYDLTDVIAIDEDTVIPQGFVVNREKIVNTLIRAKLDRIIKAAGWTWNEIVTGVKQSKLNKFLMS